MVDRRTPICLVSSGHLASNPRLVKEANALHGAGYAVRVVALDFSPLWRGHDAAILARAAWRASLVPRPGRVRYALMTAGQRLARVAWGLLGARRLLPDRWRAALAAAAHHRMSGTLGMVAAAEPAELYLAHNLAALPAAGAAARRHGAKLGFDAEDFHSGELPVSSKTGRERAIRRCLETIWLPRCAHLTAASPGIAQAYVGLCGVSPTPVLNVFSLAEAPATPIVPDGERKGDKIASFYWFSQTIGPTRGLEFMVRVLGAMREPARLVLRGNPVPRFIEQLRHLATEVGVSPERLVFLPVAAPQEMPTLAAEHDLGLALEPGATENNCILWSNKVFTYLLAGVPVALSPTPAQGELALTLGEAATLLDLDPVTAAGTLDAWLRDPARRQRARAVAWQLGQQRYNWETEQHTFLDRVRSTLRQPTEKNR